MKQGRSVGIVIESRLVTTAMNGRRSSGLDVYTYGQVETQTNTKTIKCDKG